MKILKADLGKQNQIQLVVLGDLHIGDKLCDLDLIKETIEHIRTNDNCYAILNGDLMNNALKTSKSDSYLETMSMADQQELLIELLYPIKDKILVMTTGNHEYRTNLLAGINPLKPVAIALGIKNKLVDSSYVLDLSFGSVKGGRPIKYTVFGIHGGDGTGKRIGITANALQDMANVVCNADLYVHSHTHNQISYSDAVLVFNKPKHRIEEHQRTYYNANAFLKYGGYAEQKGYRLPDRSPSAIVITGCRKKDDVKVVTDIVRI